MYIDSEEQLRALYDYPKGRSVEKVLSSLEFHSRNFIETSPFIVISTYSKSGQLDCSPRGGERGFVKIINQTQFLIPDAKGNNRLDSIMNIIDTGSIGCLFLIPGVDETLRINGKARLTTCPDHLALFSDEKHQPISCIEVSVNEVYLHCAKSLMRSKLWTEESKITRSEFPSMAKMINDQLSIEGFIESQEDMVERYKKDL